MQLHRDRWRDPRVSLPSRQALGERAGPYARGYGGGERNIVRFFLCPILHRPSFFSRGSVGETSTLPSKEPEELTRERQEREPFCALNAAFKSPAFCSHCSYETTLFDRRLSHQMTPLIPLMVISVDLTRLHKVKVRRSTIFFGRAGFGTYNVDISSSTGQEQTWVFVHMCVMAYAHASLSLSLSLHQLLALSLHQSPSHHKSIYTCSLG